MIYLLRHGMDNEEYVGGYSNISLIEEGYKQLDSAIPKLKTLNLTKIYTSDIKRTIETTNYINQTLKLTIIKDKRLRELDKGLLNGKLKNTLSIEEYRNLNTSNVDEKIGNGESMKDLYNRVSKLIERGYFDNKDLALIVTHRGFINMLYFLLNDIELSTNKEQFNVTHGSIHELDINKKRIRKIF